MSDIQLFRLSNGAAAELPSRTAMVEKHLQTLIESQMQTFLGVRFLASEYATGKTHRGRIDSLGLDENDCPVISEYKRHSNENVIWRLWQATPGKAMLSLRVVDAESGKTLSVGQSVVRYLCYILSILPLGLGFIWIAFDRKKQGWHDKIAQTVVVRATDRGPERVRFNS